VRFIIAFLSETVTLNHSTFHFGVTIYYIPITAPITHYVLVTFHRENTA